RWSSILDYLELFDGTTNSSTSLGKFWESTNATDPNYTQKDGVGVPVNVTSSENKLLLYFYSDNSGYTKEGLNLTVTLIDARKSVEDLTITIPTQTYTGSAIEPEVTVMDGKTTLTLGTDYEVSYSDNTNVGTATAKITGKGNYSGTVEKTFEITPKVTNLGALTITEDQNGATAEINGSYTDNETFSLAEDISVKSITFDRTFQQGVTSTIILPFAIESGKYSGGTFYEFQSVDYEDNKWVASMTKVSGDIEAQKPYLFVPSSDKLTIDGDVTLKACSGAEYADTKGDWTFKGVFNVKFWSKGVKTDYFFASTAATSTNGQSVNAGDFVRIGNNCGLNPFRCYLSYSGSESSLSKSEQQLPSNIEVRLIDNVASVVETDENPSDDRGDITTPVSEIIPNSGTKVWSFDKMIFIESESGFGYQIVDLSGRILKTGVTNSTREEISLGRTVGIVIVKIGGKTFKVNY
ncbi:MAG: hypothetical protein IJ150_02045, partial [Bacteroidales bacterium]|nr:hypothetical protein [Bacteroidales bacterium]